MDIQPLDILKWIGIGLAAGFVGYFGRYLAMLILDKVHKKNSQTTPVEPSAGTSVRPADTLDNNRLKLEKKKAKQAAKKAKKTGKD